SIPGVTNGEAVITEPPAVEPVELPPGLSSCRGIALPSIRWRCPGERDVAAHLISCIRALRYLAIHTIEAFPHRRGVAIDSVVHQRACNKAQLLNLLTRRQLDFRFHQSGRRLATGHRPASSAGSLAMLAAMQPRLVAGAPLID